MALNKEQFAAEVYLRLLSTNPHKTEDWLQQEALRHADEFAAALRQHNPPPKKQRREAVNV